MKCNECDGRGKLDCQECEGAGFLELDCDKCLSEGTIREGGLVVRCPECNGEGKIAEDCVECDGEGSRECESCSGSGEE